MRVNLTYQPRAPLGAIEAALDAHYYPRLKWQVAPDRNTVAANGNTRPLVEAVVSVSLPYLECEANADLDQAIASRRANGWLYATPPGGQLVYVVAVTGVRYLEVHGMPLDALKAYLLRQPHPKFKDVMLDGIITRYEFVPLAEARRLPGYRYMQVMNTGGTP